jgi:hypothetical protein
MTNTDAKESPHGEMQANNNNEVRYGGGSYTIHGIASHLINAAFGSQRCVSCAVVTEAVSEALCRARIVDRDRTGRWQCCCRIVGALIHAPELPKPPKTTAGASFAEHVKASAQSVSAWKQACLKWRGDFLRLIADEAIALPLTPDAERLLRARFPIVIESEIESARKEAMRHASNH